MENASRDMAGLPGLKWKSHCRSATVVVASCVLLWFCLPYFATRGVTDDDTVSTPATRRWGLKNPGITFTDRSDGRSGGGDGTPGSYSPRILTVLTTYANRSSLIKPYKEASSNRSDNYQPTIFAVSNAGDDASDEVVDFKTGSAGQHRALAAIAEACSRHEGTFDWIALGDDDTVFLYSRAMSFLGHIDHTKPVAIASVEGINAEGIPLSRQSCFSPESLHASKYDCLPASEWTNSGSLHPPTSASEVHDGEAYNWRSEYGPRGLFWGYGGSGVFVSVGLVDAVGGVDGLLRCAEMFSDMNTDMQLAACFKYHGHSFGRYEEGFARMFSPDSSKIKAKLSHDCQIFGVHLGFHQHEHIKVYGHPYNSQTFEEAVKAVQEEDTSFAASGGVPTLESTCPKAIQALSRHLEHD